MRSFGASDWSSRVHSPTVSTSAAEDAIGDSLLLLGWLLWATCFALLGEAAKDRNSAQLHSDPTLTLRS